MPRDAYDPCPCGSGKKFKFCCIDLADRMEKVERHIENDQNRMALGVLDRLRKKHPDNAWVLVDRASILLDQDEHAEAKATLDELLEKHPEHPTGMALHAVAALFAEGYEASKSTINRAIEWCSRQRPDIVSDLAISVASLMLLTDRHLAARRFLTLAMRLAIREETQQQIFLRLLEFDGNRNIPYPLRSVHQLAPYTGAAEVEKQAAGAGRLSDLGCWDAAAEVFNRLAENEPDNAVLWQNTGLCRAWTGDEAAAADALHLAARLHDNYETAVELETIAQLLDLENSEERIAFPVVRYRVDSLSRLLSELSSHDRIASLPLLPQTDEEEERPDAYLEILDRPPPDPAELESLSIDTVPNVSAEVTLFDADPDADRPAMLLLRGLEGEAFQEARELLEAAAGDHLHLDDEQQQEEHLNSIPQQTLFLQWRWHIPLQAPAVLVQRLEEEKWRQIIDDIWPNRPQEALRDKTPLQAVGDQELRVPLAGAVYALDALCDRHHYALDLSRMCERLQLERPEPITPSEETPLNTFSSMQLFRLSVSDLSDDQLRLALNRALLLRHSGFLYRVLKQVEKRPECLKDASLDQVYVGLFEVSREQRRREESLQWIDKARQNAETEEDSFQKKIQWEMRETMVRVEDPDDPQLKPLIQRIHSSYCTKLPELEPVLVELCSRAGIQPPWQTGREAPVSGAVTETGVWTPEAAGDQGEKKLWLPGQ